MIKTILHGCNGHMGRVLSDMIAEDNELTVVAGVDITDDDRGFPIYRSIKDCKEDADVVIDFSTAKAIDALVSDCEDKQLPVVLCTTGLSEEQLKKVDALSKTVPVLRAANMSLGINTLLDTVRRIAPVFAKAGFDIEIVEKHHSRKLDAPSGTAMAFADEMNDALNHEYTYIYDRSTRRESRDPKEIGISAVRGGNIVGEHEIIFAGMDEVITLKHQATSRSILAKGAMEAAKFLASASPKMYSMQDVIRG